MLRWLAIFSLFLFLQVASAQVIVQLQPAKLELKPGEELKVLIWIDPAGNEVAGCDMNVSYEAGVFSFVEIQPGNVWFAKPLSTLNTLPGLVRYSLVSPTPFAFPGILATLTLKVSDRAAQGSYPISLQVELSNAQGQSITDVESEGTTIKIESKEAQAERWEGVKQAIPKIEEEYGKRIEELKERLERVKEPKEELFKLKFNFTFTPYLQNITLIPKFRCPAALVIELPYKAYFGYAYSQVRQWLEKQNYTLPELCTDRAQLETLIGQALAELNLTEICRGLQRAAERCEAARAMPCELVVGTYQHCLQGLHRCKLAERQVEISKEEWKERLKALKEEWKAKREAIERVMGKEVEIPEPKFPLVEGKLLRCEFEEDYCEHIRQGIERCQEFQTYCAQRCEVVASLAQRCLVEVKDVEELKAKLVDFLWKHCTLLNFTLPELPAVANETIRPAEVLPILLLTDPLTPEQRAQVEALVTELEELTCKLEQGCAYRAKIRADLMHELKELPFVKWVKVDHVLRAMEKRPFLPLKLPEHAPNVSAILPCLEGVRQQIEAELQPLVVEAELKTLNATQQISRQHQEEKARGIGYRILYWLGLQVGREQEDAKFVEQQAKQLQATIASLQAIAKVTKDPSAKALVLEQVAKLQQSVDHLVAKASEKRKRASGIWSWLFG